MNPGYLPRSLHLNESTDRKSAHVTKLTRRNGPCCILKDEPYPADEVSTLKSIVCWHYFVFGTSFIISIPINIYSISPGILSYRFHPTFPASRFRSHSVMSVANVTASKHAWRVEI